MTLFRTLRRRKGERLPLSALKTRSVQKRWATLLAGKMAGLAAVLGIMQVVVYLLGEPAGAQDAAPTVAENLISPINTMWVLVAAFLVFFMQAGFMALEAGFARERESVNIMLECIVDTCLCACLLYTSPSPRD